ncbi:RagB/SusD family nutrient uptake outer membrane protein [Sphingobacterium olei]|nr:RagB/SusD family nutrient uptake outer membrane protein [Sphingobacterium olei]
MKILLYICFPLILLSGCSQFVEIDPPFNAVTDATAYRTDATATSVVTGLYQIIINSPFTADGAGLGLFTSLQTDELKYHLTTAATLEFATNALTAENTNVLGIWTRAYQVIYGANAVIEGVSRSTTLTPSVKDQLLGEAKFVRAFMYFYLVNLYGSVPLALTTDYKVNISLKRSPSAEVYQQIITDLSDAETLLTEAYMSATNVVTNDRVRPNRTAASALLARVYLYTGDYVNAESKASAVIAQSSVYKMDPDLDKVFLVGSQEAIWQLGQDANVSGINTYEGYNYILISDPTTNYPGITLSEDLATQLQGTKRGMHWVQNFTVGTTAYPYAFKYKVRQAASRSAITEHLVVLRLAEQYLIRAEARALQNNFDQAAQDLNAVRSRYNLADIFPENLPDFMIALEQERKLELFTEWGHRWFDINRWRGFSNPSISRADEVMPDIAAAKGGAWRSAYRLWPIPMNELLVNVNLDPNPGYGL